MTKHDGRKKHPLYRIWKDMRHRCDNERRHDYPYYGGRGIDVCARWREDFWAFVADMGERPSLKHTIERINNNGNYEPGNCCWETQKGQGRNMKHTQHLTLGDQTHPLGHWARQLGIDRATLRYRLQRWPLEEALTRPKQW